MKVIFIFLLFGFIFLCGCSSPFSPVGTWNLYIKRNNKVENMQTPETVMMIYHDGTFLCVAKENPHPEYNKGNWCQKGKKIVFNDKNGQYGMFINKDSLILEQQPFKPQGMELIYLRKHSEK
jgi:thioredoxin-related protein